MPYNLDNPAHLIPALAKGEVPVAFAPLRHTHVCSWPVGGYPILPVRCALQCKVCLCCHGCWLVARVYDVPTDDSEQELFMY